MLWLFLALAVALLLYWELVIAEGAHLGARVVVWLYDLAAPRYERIKHFNPKVESDILGLPLAEALAHVDEPLVLDVAAGTGRVARALLPEVAFDGAIISLDLSARMIVQGRRILATAPGRVHWLLSPACRLPFPCAVFHAVTCVEALEFFPNARDALAECVRVLRPGGLLLVSNRIGREVLLMPGKTFSRPAFEKLLAEYPLQSVLVYPWQVDYDLAWAWKRDG